MKEASEILPIQLLSAILFDEKVGSKIKGKDGVRELEIYQVPTICKYYIHCDKKKFSLCIALYSEVMKSSW